MHVHYLPNLSLSYARHTDTLNKTFLILSSDYSKTAHLQEDRSVEFHTPQGCHYSLRIPRYGRDLAYNRATAELLVPAVGVNSNGVGQVFRINLEQGRFMREYEIDVGGDDLASSGAGALQGSINTGSVNTVAVAENSHNLMAFGTSLGTVEYWDSRSRARVGALIAPRDCDGPPQITALEFHRSGITTAVGTSTGLIYLYDLRSPTPILKKDHGYGYPIQTLQFLTPSTSTRAQTPESKILSSDKRILKIWDERTGLPWTSVEPAVDINSVAWCKDSGIFLTANEGRQQHVFFVPQLGPAPRWCSFLDNIVEEMADDPNDPHAFSSNRKTGEIYDNYKFLTLAQLRTINLDHLIGKTNLLRPYMHGYFVAQRLYEEARLIADPSSWEEERAKHVKEKIDKERESRIRGKKKVTMKVNRKLAERVLEREEKNERRRARRVMEQGREQTVENEIDRVGTVNGEANREDKGILADWRFARLFQDEDYAVDETSREFQSLNPSTRLAPASNLDREKGLTAVEEEALDEVPRSSEDDRSRSEPEGAPAVTRSDRISTADYKRRPQSKRQKKKPMQMQVSSSSKVARPSRERSFGSRAVNTKARERIRRPGRVAGEKVVTFEPQSGRKKDSLIDGGRTSATDGHSATAKGRRSASGNTFRRM